MHQKQLNSLAADYRLTGCPQAFAELYAAMEHLKDVNRNGMRRMGYVDDNDADTVFTDTFMRVIGREVTESFERLLSRSLKNARIDFDRSQKRKRRREVSLDAPTSDAPDAPTLGMTLKSSDYGAYDTEFEALEIKKRAEQRQLLDSLLESATDSLTKKIVNLFPEYDSANALAKALGVHHSVVNRRLKSLARRYDVSRFGNIYDYLAS